MDEFDQARRARDWILRQCDPSGRPIQVELPRENFPDGLTRELTLKAFEQLKKEGRVSGNVLKSPYTDNTEWTILGLTCQREQGTRKTQ